MTPENIGQSMRPSRSKTPRSFRTLRSLEGGKNSASALAPGVKLVARSSAVSYADINFVQSVLNTLASGPYIARVYCAAPVESRDWQRRELAAQLRSTIMQMRGDIDSSEDD